MALGKLFKDVKIDDKIYLTGYLHSVYGGFYTDFYKTSMYVIAYTHDYSHNETFLTLEDKNNGRTMQINVMSNIDCYMQEGMPICFATNEEAIDFCIQKKLEEQNILIDKQIKTLKEAKQTINKQLNTYKKIKKI